MAVQALKDGDIQSFTDIINSREVENELDDPNHWINSGREEEDGLNLSELCVQMDIKDALSTMVRLGVNMDLVNPVTGYSSLHRAAELGKPDLLGIILKTRNHIFDVNARTAKRKKGITALHLAASQVSNDHLKCIEILLSQPFIEVNTRDSSLTTTPLYAAGKVKNFEAVTKLIESGANPDILVGTTNKTIRDFILSWMPGFDIDKIKVLRQNKSSDHNVKDQLLEIIKTSQVQDQHYMQKFLKFKELCSRIDSAENGFEEIVELACRKGLADFALTLFKKGANPNKFSGNSKSCPLLDAGEEGSWAIIKVLKKFDVDITVCKDQTNETILHCILKSIKVDKEEDYIKCLDLILNESNEDFKKKVKGIINRKDVNGNCALHYSTEKWPYYITRALLQNGANIGIKNDWGEIPISRIPPQVMETFLDEDCLLSNGKDVFHKELEVTFKYDFLAPDPHSLPDCFKPHEELEECTPLSPKESSMEEKGHALPETESLWYMGQSKEHRHLLKHPVITSFLWYKWERIRPYFNRNLRLYLLFVFLLTWYIFVNFGGVSQRDSIQHTFYWSYLVFFSLLVIMIIRDWYQDIQDALRAESLGASSKNCIKPDLTISSPKLLLELIACNWIDILTIACSAVIFGLDHHLLHVPVIVIISFIILRELLQMAVSLKRYFTSFENWIELAMIAIVIALVCNNTGDSLLLNRHLAAVAIVFSWAELITLIGRHPKLLHCNVYVTMFYKVLNSFFFFLLWYSLFIIAFGLGFYIMLHNDDDGANLHSLDDEDKNHLFNRTWISLVKTSAMFVGELEFSDIPINSDTYLGIMAYIFFLTFIFLIVVVLMNLLNGMAVNDTSEIKQKAEIYSYISRVETISYMECVLLGDPFNFLTNVPYYLSNLPSGSILRQLYRNGLCSRLFKKIGAKRFLLFYTYMKDKQISLTPNQNNECCAMAGDEMGSNIIASAKQILGEKIRAGTNNDNEGATVSSLKEEVVQLRSEVAKLSDVSKKIELLLSKR